MENHAIAHACRFQRRTSLPPALLTLLGSLLVAAAVAAAPAATVEKPPIPVRFSLERPGLVTLVIEDERRRRVRNLISETPFSAGAHVVAWDGLDDLGRDPEAARHGVYQIPARFVAPGRYRVRGLTHQPLHLRYEFSVYNAGRPAWETPDGRGGWLANHTLDRVEDVSDQVALTAGVEGDYELSVLLSLLGLDPSPGLVVRGDVGILRGNGFQTLQRVYWHNKATGITSDVPSEAELTPQLWGTWRV